MSLCLEISNLIAGRKKTHPMASGTCFVRATVVYVIFGIQKSKQLVLWVEPSWRKKIGFLKAMY